MTGRDRARLWLRRGVWSSLAALTGLLLIGKLVRAQEAPPPPPCTCADLPRLKDRLQKLEGIQKLVARKVQSATPDARATQDEWNAVEAEISSYLKALQLQNMTDFPDSSLFPVADPSCDPVPSLAPACTEKEFEAHQHLHAASCSAGKWNWNTAWMSRAMLQEEAAALQAEIDTLKEIIEGLHCGPCPQFMVTVQLETKIFHSEAAVVVGSERSLNNKQGIQVPLTMSADGSFKGMGTGVDAGGAAGGTVGERISGDFGHLQSIYATGTIQPGSGGDLMHLTLYGGSSTQITEMQARGEVNRDLNQATPTGPARLYFDLPAYLGSTAQRTLVANGTITSVMRVTVGQAANGAPALNSGSSVLLSVKECRTAVR